MIMNKKLKKYGTLCLIATIFVACKDANSQQQKEAVVKQEQKEVVDTQEHNCVTTEPEGPIVPDSVIYDYCKEMPEFPGGMEKLIQFIVDNTHLPKCTTAAGVEGQSLVEFVVEKDGTLSDFKIVRSLHPDCDSEAIRVLKTMPRWKPGKERGKPIRVKYTVPVQFKRTFGKNN